jgi:RNA polymerase sigma-70 factor (ECF subfamily)
LAEERDDQQLAQRAATGDRAAFEELVKRHRGGVYRLCWSVTGNHADADDAAQESFLRVFRSLPSFDPARPFSPWLRRIAHNASLDILAARKSRGAVSLEDDSVDPPDPSPTPEGAAAGLQEQAIAEEALAGLPPGMREAFLLRAAEGLSYREIADATGAPLGTVMSRISRARERLLTALNAERKGEVTR